MAIYITWDGGSWYFDVTINEQHESKLEITEHPVEQGPDITDNARRTLDRFSCEVFVSNSPIADLNNFGGNQKKINLDNPAYRNGQPAKYDPPFAPTPGAVFGAVENAISSVADAIFGKDTSAPAADVLAFDTPFDAVVYSHQLLTWLQDYAKLVTVYTSADIYQNMLLEVQQLRREREDGDGGRYRLTFKQIRTVSLAFTDAPTPKDPRGEAPVDKGAKGTKDAPPAEKESVAVNLSNAAANAYRKYVSGK